jgi:hypothetical protein
MVTALLKGDPEDPRHSLGIYHFGMRATLVKPWFVKLVTPRLLRPGEMQMDVWKSEWREFVAQSKIRKEVEPKWREFVAQLKIRKDVEPNPPLQRDSNT